MKKQFFFRFSAGLTAAVTAAVCLGSIPTLAVKTNTDDAALKRYANQVIVLVNRERAAYGLYPLYGSAIMQTAAAERAEECTELFDHTRPDGSSCFSVLSDYGISYTSAGENIAMGYESPEAVVSGWMHSDGHRANILNENYQYIGVGVADSGTRCWTQIFTGGIKPEDASAPVEHMGQKGDVDYDGDVTLDDAFLTLSAYSRKAAGNAMGMNDMQTASADIDGDGTITIDDAFLILQYYSYGAAGRDVTWDALQ